MCVARSSYAALVLSVSAVCLGCNESPTEVAPKQPPTQVEQQPPKAEPEVPSKPLVAVTPRAAKSIREVVESLDRTGTCALRLEAFWPNGICCPQHKLNLEITPPSSMDYAFESGGIKVVVLKRQADMFRGAQIDYGEKNGSQGFILNNPNFEGELLKKWGPIVAADPLSAGK